ISHVHSLERRRVRILILTFYFEPDLSAGSFRTGALVRALDELAPRDARIDVMTSLPNRYASFTAEAPEHEDRGRVSVRRIPVPAHAGGMLDQARAFASFA